ncbi:hypothetical protein [Chrysodeixis includens nucleopolyhedrovirus]|uniref:Uncharacterized protein n=1 Tax=Chrysodeixis includens nucleopolyhedrovirus TaxID=1207438 RepID=A0A1C8ZYU3_9ABAC|nr:hypothetical protein [Chrysodeixis includens nucleopolyhedrovirus]AOL56700.1 hypothetical protein [Chrysodeixis includens nucleopolyhedrovirus]AOL56842.1 hypothetical protein [Chrysodeixis includens nucleopolyhedrovirus]AOL56984.1 hypothetical protein [Chrysodeixis includens nucleopolyhedrovirus]
MDSINLLGKRQRQQNMIWGGDITDQFSSCCLVSPREASQLIMLTTRIASTLIMSLLIASAYYVATNKAEFFLYYSHWSMISLFVMFFAGAVTSFFGRFEKNNGNDRLPWYVNIQWLFFNVACSSNLLTSAIYFIVIMVYKYHNNISSPVNNVIHFCNSLLVLFEVCVSSVPVRLKHVYQPLLFTLFYGFFLACYNYYTGDPVYRFLDWSNGREMFKLSSCCVLLLLTFYVILYTVHVVKEKVINTIV